MEQQKFVDLYTQAGEELNGIPWDVYPRPQMRRDSFYNLNGMWDFALSPEEGESRAYDQQIRVPEQYIRGLKIRTGLNWAEICVDGDAEGGRVVVQLPEGEQVALLENGKARIELSDPRLWSPEDPHLYQCEVVAGEDRVSTYFALRTLTRERVNGVWRLCLNGKPYFFHGVLDQGYWSDGLSTPASADCYRQDILAMKELGFNTLREHIKIEPEQFYYDCDRLGMVVFQDMVNNGDYNFLRDTALPKVGWKNGMTAECTGTERLGSSS